MKQKVYNHEDGVINYYMDKKGNLYLLKESELVIIPAKYVVYVEGKKPIIKENAKPEEFVRMTQKLYDEEYDEPLGYIDDEGNVYLVEEFGIIKVPAEDVIEESDELGAEEDGELYDLD